MEIIEIGDIMEVILYYDGSLKVGCRYSIVSLDNHRVCLIDDDDDKLYIEYSILETYFKKVESRNQEQRRSGGSTHYYELPENATELKHLIRHKKMSHPIGEAFCSLYRLNDNGEYKRNLEKAKYYIETELQYLEEGRK